MNIIEKKALINHINNKVNEHNSQVMYNPVADHPNNKPWIEFDKDNNVTLIRKSLY